MFVYFVYENTFHSSCGGPTTDGRRTWTFDEAEKCGFSITSDGTSITFEFDFTAVKKVGSKKLGKK